MIRPHRPRSIDQTFAGRRALVTGAGAGIGRAVAVQLAARGAAVTLWDRDGDGVAATEQLCRPFGGEVAQRKLDVGDAAAVSSAAEALGELDLVLCLAGEIHTGGVLASELPDLERVIRTNFWGTVHAVKAVLPRLIESGRGHVVTFSSAFGMITVPRYSAYCASKFAIRGFSEALTQELLECTPPVAVSCVYPGGVRTGIVRHGSFAVGERAAEVTDLFERRVARLTPERAATVILRGVARRRCRILVGSDARLAWLLGHVTGGSYPRILPRIAGRAGRAEHRSRRSADLG